MESVEPVDPAAMPGTVRMARVLTYVASALVLLFGLLYVALALGDTQQIEEDYNVSPGALGVIGAILLAHGAAGVALGRRYVTRRAGVRTGGMVWAGLGAAIGLGTAPLGLLIIVLVVLVLVNLIRDPSRVWFRRALP